MSVIPCRRRASPARGRSRFELAESSTAPARDRTVAPAWRPGREHGARCVTDPFSATERDPRGARSGQRPDHDEPIAGSFSTSSTWTHERRSGHRRDARRRAPAFAAATSSPAPGGELARSCRPAGKLAGRRERGRFQTCASSSSASASRAIRARRASVLRASGEIGRHRIFWNACPRFCNPTAAGAERAQILRRHGRRDARTRRRPRHRLTAESARPGRCDRVVAPCSRSSRARDRAVLAVRSITINRPDPSSRSGRCRPRGRERVSIVSDVIRGTARTSRSRSARALRTSTSSS